MQLIFVKLNTAGSDTGPFMIYSNVDGYITAYGVNISKAALTVGVNISVPDFTTSVKIRSNGKCTNSIFVSLPGAPTTTSTTTSSTTTSTSSTSSTTSSTTSTSSSTTTTTSAGTTTSTSTTAGGSVDCSCQKAVFNPPDGLAQSVSYYDCEVNPKTGFYPLITEIITPGTERCINTHPSAITPSIGLFTPISGTGCPECSPVLPCNVIGGCRTWTFTIPIGDPEGIVYKKCDGSIDTAFSSGTYCVCEIPISSCPDCIALNFPNTACKT